MKITGKDLKYEAYGLTLSSELFFPELKSVDQCNHPDVIIKYDEHVEDKAKLFIENKSFYYQEDLVMFRIDDTGIFLIQDGNRISISKFGNVDEDKLRLYILGSCMGAILLQRRILPLHGSVVEIDGKAYAFVGESGAGKSTLASAFLQKGYQLLSDDVIAVDFIGDVPHVIPSFPQQKLWDKSLTIFGMNEEDYQPLFERETKYAVPIKSGFIENPLPLVGVFELIKEKDNLVKVKIQPTRGLERLRTLFLHTYRNFFVPNLDLVDWHFLQSTKLINSIDMYKILRPSHSFTAYEITDKIINTIKGGKQNVIKYYLIK